MKTKIGKLLLLLCSTPLIIMMLMINWSELYNSNNVMVIIQGLIFIISIVYTIVSYIISKINIHREESNYEVIDYEYYRDILKETSSGLLGFVYNKRINYVDTLISTILKLEKEMYIKIDYENKNMKLLKKECSNLSEYEKYMLDIFEFEEKNSIIDFNRLKEILKDEIFKINIKTLIKKSAKEKEYYKTKKYNDNILVYVLVINTFLTFSTFFTDFFILECTTVCFINTLLLWLFAYIEQKFVYIRTQKGKELSEKLCGLKKYIQDFSMINEKKTSDIVLWDYYIIYGIIFNMKGNLNDDVNKLYNILVK